MTRSRVYYSWKNTDSGHGGVYKREQKGKSATAQTCKSATRGETTAPPGLASVRSLGGGRQGSLPTWHTSPECPDVDIRTEHTATHASRAPGPGTHSDCHRHPGPGRAKEAPASPPTADHTRGVRVRASPSTHRRKDSHQRPHQSVHCKGSLSTAQGQGTGGWGGDAGTHVVVRSRTELLLEGREPRFTPGQLPLSGAHTARLHTHESQRLSGGTPRPIPGQGAPRTSPGTLGTEPRRGPHGARPPTPSWSAGVGQACAAVPTEHRGQRARSLPQITRGFPGCSRQMLFFFPVLRLQHEKC